MLLKSAPSDDLKSHCMSKLIAFLNDETEFFVDDLLEYIESTFIVCFYITEF